MKRRHERKQKLNTLDKVLVILASFLFLFITSSVVIYTVKDWQYDTLITMVLSGGGVETVAAAVIQIAKYKHKDKEADNDTGNDNESN